MFFANPQNNKDGIKVASYPMVLRHWGAWELWALGDSL